MLNNVIIGFLTQDELNKTWNEWSREIEIKKKEIYERWLTDKFGLIRGFKWGSLEAYYDSKGGSSGILLKYK
jgi:hypothetical protein